MNNRNQTNNPNNNNNSISEEEKIKKTSIFIGEINVNVQIKTDKNIYLEENITKKKYIFKQILLEGTTNDFIYVKIRDEGIRNIFAITDWMYPKFDGYF